MIDFQPVKLDDKLWVRDLMLRSGFRGGEYCFGNLYLWKDVYGCKIARMNDYFLAKMGHTHPSYIFPAGSGDIYPVLDALWEDSRACGHPFRMHGLSPEAAQLVEAWKPGALVFEDNRDYYDYIYTAEKLRDLAGKKLHGKRNHIARFIDNNNWRYERITEQNIEDCVRMSRDWSHKNGVIDDIDKQNEYYAVSIALENFFALDFFGGILRVDDKVVAYTVGERLSEDTMIVHIEKAYHDIQGAYPMINREFVRDYGGAFTYVNREEDMGSEGLRKAKLSYYPDILYVKIRAAEVGSVR